jgi:hypothetical protein
MGSNGNAFELAKKTKSALVSPREPEDRLIQRESPEAHM